MDTNSVSGGVEIGNVMMYFCPLTLCVSNVK